MKKESYLRWLASETPTCWWHDSADPEELRRALEHGASGVTTNPPLVFQTLTGRPNYWLDKVRNLPPDLSGAERAEAITRIVVCEAAQIMLPEFDRTNGQQGYVCGQVDPAKSSAESMVEMARRFHVWAPNIAVKLPATAAGLEALEECAAEGITVTATVSFTVPQVVAVAKHFQKGAQRARQSGKKAGRCFAVIMIGRLDDYLRDVIHDQRANIPEPDIKQAGIAVCKRAYSIYKDQGYEAVLLIAALRGVHHMVPFAGAELVMSIHPKNQALLMQPGIPREKFIDEPVDKDTLDRLTRIPEFVRAYEPEGMKPEEFFTYGLTQRTLTQFSEIGWLRLETYL